jgi:hypothetical protein
MKMSVASLCAVIAGTVILTLVFSATVMQPKAAAAPAVGVSTPVAAVAGVPMPPHPRVHEALEALHNAKDHMAHAEGEFHGHRDKSIEHIDAAIHEAEICDREP